MATTTWYDYPGGAPGAAPANVGPDNVSTNWMNDGNTDFTAYGRLLDNNMGLPAGQNTQANATTNINNKMSQMCHDHQEPGHYHLHHLIRP